MEGSSAEVWADLWKRGPGSDLKLLLVPGTQSVSASSVGTSGSDAVAQATYMLVAA